MRLSCGGDNSPAFRSLPLRALSSVGDTSDICSETLLSGNLQQTSGVRFTAAFSFGKTRRQTTSSLAWISRSSSQESGRVGSRRQPDARCFFPSNFLEMHESGMPPRGDQIQKISRSDQPVRNAPEKIRELPWAGANQPVEDLAKPMERLLCMGRLRVCNGCTIRVRRVRSETSDGGKPDV
jgi:hypothetical protein